MNGLLFILQEWNDELASIAQAYSEKCVFEHNPDRDSQSQTYEFVGENLATRTSGSNWGENELLQLMDQWHDEREDFTLETNSCDDVCGHYTQVKKILACMCNAACTCNVIARMLAEL